MKARYELTLSSRDNVWFIECWDSLHHMWLTNIELGTMSHTKAEKALQATYRSMNKI